MYPGAPPLKYNKCYPAILGITYSKHMKNYCKDALQGKNIKTFAATCSKVGHEPRDVIFATSFDLVLLDEALNVTERVEELLQRRSAGQKS